MRAELSTIQQTLTPEAATVLNHSIAEAGRRNHGQTTPIHVAATLLASPSGYLRQACIKSHPNSSHPLQCRALELCFSVALERLPTAQNMSPGLDPPISNALMAALKRAQAHQRRGCPEQQQQPLLAVKVELEQLIISILDDPSVSRVMREASFSSPAVKATIEQSLNSPPSTVASSPIGLGFRPTPAATTSRNLYLNPRLQQGGAAAQSGQQRGEEVKRVMDIFLRTKKRNPVLVGDSEPEAVMKAVLTRIENREVGEGLLKNVEVIHLDKEFINDRDQIPLKIKELGAVVDARIGNLSGGGIILDLGDLKWLVHEPAVPGSGTMQQKVATEAGRPAVSEMGKLLARFREREEASGGSGRVWLAGTATCETYLRCQVYYSSLEVDWDLQAVPIAARAPMSGLFPRLGGNGILSSSVDALSPLKGSTIAAAGAVQPRRLSENLDPTQRTSCCPQCMRSYEQELAKLGPKDSEKFSSEIKPEAARPALPQWLQNAKPHDGGAKTTDQLQNNDQEIIWKQKAEELKKKWTDICIRQHNFGSDRIAPATLSVTGLYNSNLLGRQPFQPKFQLNRSLGDTMKLNPSLVPSQPAVRTATPPGSPVRTELALGNSKVPEITPEKARKELTKDFLGCISSEPENRIHELQSDKLASAFDTNSFKKLLKGLLEKVYWQREAASAVATTVTKCKMGNGKRRSGGPKGDTWLLFMGPDRVGKKKMAAALADLVCGTTPITISLGSRRNDGESDVNFRGKTVLDRIGDAIRRNPFSVIVLEDIDEVDMLLRGSIKRAMERGRLADSNGREISLANVMFILTASILPENLRFLSNGISLDEEKLASLARGNWQLRLSLCEKSMKRRANWLHDGDNRTTKTKKLDAGSGLSFDLNEAAADAEDERAAGPSNSSDLTVDHEDDHGLDNRQSLATTASAAAAARELLNYVDDAIVFKPVDFGPIRRDIANSITKKFSAIISEGHTIEVPDEALEKILSGVWLGRTGLEEWTEKVLVPSFHQLKAQLSSNVSSTINESMVVRLEPDGDANSRRYGDWLPSNVKVVSNSNGL